MPSIRLVAKPSLDWVTLGRRSKLKLCANAVDVPVPSSANSPN